MMALRQQGAAALAGPPVAAASAVLRSVPGSAWLPTNAAHSLMALVSKSTEHIVWPREHPCAIPSTAVWAAKGAQRCRKALG
jgi:hypothetical protein